MSFKLFVPNELLRIVCYGEVFLFHAPENYQLSLGKPRWKIEWVPNTNPNKRIVTTFYCSSLQSPAVNTERLAVLVFITAQDSTRMPGFLLL